MKSNGPRGWVRSFLQAWLSWPRLRASTGHYRLQVEILEDRVVPSSWLVTNTSNNVATSGSLPWAVAQADTDTSNANITFSPAAFPNATTIGLATQLSLTNTSHSITIDGGGAGPITVSGGGTNGIFKVGSGTMAAVNNLTLSAGSAPYSGGIYNLGTLTASYDILTGISGGYGAIYNTGMATLGNCTITNCATTGISTINTMVVNNSTISANTGLVGAGVYDAGAALTIINCTISGNSASSTGGAVNATANASAVPARVTIIGSAISGNAAWGGGGISNYGSTMTLVDTTIANNTTTTAVGGGVTNGTYNGIGGSLSADNCTIVNNQSATSGGGILSLSSCTLTLGNCIVAGNSAPGAGPDIDGAVTAGNNNLIGNGADMTGLVNGTGGNQVGTAANPIHPLLNPLSNNGGPTQTMSEQTGSPAIGAGGVVTTLGNAVADTTSNSITIPNYAIFAAQTLPVLTSNSYFILQIDGEQMAVTGLNPASGTAGTLTVVRGVNGTAAATHSSGAPLYLVSDQRGFAVPSNNPPVADIGAYQGTGSVLLPTVASLSPNNGSSAGGASVVITGTNFTDATAVMFGANNAATFTVNSDSQITATDPAGTGVVDVAVVTSAGTSATSNADQFTYIAATTTSVSSNPVGPITPGTSVAFTANITGNPSVGTVSFYYDYDAADQFQIGGAVNVSNGSATSDATTALPAGADTVTAIYSGGIGFQGSTGTLIIQVSAPPPSITNVVINQDISALYNAAGQPVPGKQRSMVEDIVYTFSEAVNITSPAVDPSVFTVAVASGLTGTAPPTLAWAAVAGSGNTQWEVDFGGGSIANGAYTITVTDPGSITAQSDSQALSLATDGIGVATQSFERLFGDINGDGFVNAYDNARFKQALMTYNPAFDYNQDSVINASDNYYLISDLDVNSSGFTPTI